MIRSRIGRILMGACLLAPLGWAAPAFGGDGLFGLGRPAAIEPVPESMVGVPASKVSTLRWSSVPRRARVVLWKMAASEGALLSRSVLIEQDEQVVYQIHASRRVGLFRREDYVLTEFSEPKGAAEARRAERTLKSRLARLRGSNDSGMLLPQP